VTRARDEGGKRGEEVEEEGTRGRCSETPRPTVFTPLFLYSLGPTHPCFLAWGTDEEEERAADEEEVAAPQVVRGLGPSQKPCLTGAARPSPV
jgi:hypothetical protein